MVSALKAAGSAHHHYQTGFLKGVRDEYWAGWYAAYALGRLGDFIDPSKLTECLLADAGEGDWSENIAEIVLSKI